METRFVKIAGFILLSLVFSACDKFESRGFIVSYESADERFNSSMVWNAVHPYKEITVPVEDYSIYIMADSHVGSTKNLDLFLDKAGKMNATAVVMIGDLTNGHAADYDDFQQHLPSRDSLLTFQTTGNHDLFFGGWDHFYALFGSSTYLFTVNTPHSSDLYICLDSGGGTLGEDQLEWLKAILQADRSKYRHCILFTHNNLFRERHTFSTNPPVDELLSIMELNIENHVDMVISGHDHERNVVEFGNTTYITLDALEDGFKNSGYLVLSCNQDKAEYEFISLGI
jgi:predicted phosphodiesterase